MGNKNFRVIVRIQLNTWMYKLFFFYSLLQSEIANKTNHKSH